MDKQRKRRQTFRQTLRGDALRRLPRGRNVDIFNSARDLRVLVHDGGRVVVDTKVTELEGEDVLGRFVLRQGSDDMLTALVPGMLLLRKRDGRTLRLLVSWGALTAARGEVRIVAEGARLRLAGKTTRAWADSRLEERLAGVSPAA